MRIYLFSILAAMVLGLQACSSGDDSGGGNFPDMNGEVQADKAKLNDLSQGGPQLVDQSFGNGFTKLFGDTTGASVRSYLDLRVKHTYDFDHMQTFQISNQNSDTITIKELWGAGEPQGQPEDEKAMTTAINMGAALWMLGEANNMQVKLHLPSGVIPIDSTRAGVIATTKHYKTVTFEDGTKQAMPYDGRVSVLVHEGRHSDCPNEARCGYFHAACPTGHELAGELACDDKGWGAYGTGMIYLLATHANATDENEQRILNALLLDTITRIPPDVRAEMKLTSPDLSSN